MNEKWNTQNRKGRLSQDPRCCRYKDKRNPCFGEVTDEKVHDSKMLKKLVNHVLKTVPNEKNKVKS